MKSIKWYKDDQLVKQLIKEKADAKRYLLYARKYRSDREYYFYLLHMVGIHMRRIREILQRLKYGCDGTFNLNDLEV